MPGFCPEQAELEAFAKGQAPPDLQDSIEQHLDDCAHCRKRLTDWSAETASWLRPFAQNRQRELSEGLNQAIECLKRGIPRLPRDRLLESTGSCALPPLGEHEILAELGRGGMGIVFRARQTSLQREVALKVILSGRFADADEVRRFRLEAEAAARLDHPQIVPVYEIGEQDGHHFFSMKLVPGGSLAEKLAKLRGPAGSAEANPFWSTAGFREVASLIRTVARAVHYAHQRGVLHRDLKPSNILLDEDGTPHVTDFGLAKIVSLDEQLTFSNAVMGTPSYMAPEQAAGKSREVTTAADIYSLGAILYEILTGLPPFRTDNFATTLEAVLHQEPVRPKALNPVVPLELETVCLKCLRKEPDHRYSTAGELADDLDRFLAGQPVTARRVGTFLRALMWARRQPALAAALAGIVVVFLAGFTTTIWLWRREARQRLIALNETTRALQANISLELEQSFRSGNASRALATLARLARDQRDHRVVTERLMNALTYRTFLLPVARLQHDANGHAQPGTSSDSSAGPRATPLRVTRFSHDGRLVMTGSRDGRVRFWNGRTGVPVGEPLQHPGPLLWADLDAHGERAITAGTDGLILIWHLNDRGSLPGSVRASEPVRYVEFSPDGTQLVAACGVQALVWRVNGLETSEQRVLDPRHRGRFLPQDVHRLVFAGFSPDGQRVLTAGESGPALLWDLQKSTVLLEVRHQYRIESRHPFPQFSPSGQEILVFDGPSGFLRKTDSAIASPRPLEHYADVIALAFASDGLHVATGGHDARVRLWDSATGDSSAALVHGQTVNTIQFSPDSRRLLTGSRDRSVRLWNLTSPEQNPEPGWHQTAVLDAWFNLPGDRILTAEENRTAWLWEVNRPHSPVSVTNLSKAVKGLQFDPSGSFAAALHARSVGLIDIRQQCVVDEFKPPPPLPPDGRGRRSEVEPDEGASPRFRGRSQGAGARKAPQAPVITAMHFSRDGKFLAIGMENGHTVVWDIELRRPGGPPYGDPEPGPAAVRGIRFGPGDKVFATVSDSGRVTMWKTGIPEPRWSVTLPERANDMEFSPDGRRLAVACWDHRAWVFDVESGKESLSPPAHQAEVNWVRFDASGDRILTASRDKTIQIWSSQSRQQLILRHADAPAEQHSFALSPDGARIVSIAGDGMYVWDGANGRLLVGPVRLGALILSARFSPDGARLVTACDDGTACLWDPNTGQPLGEPWKHQARVASAEFSPDGQYVVTGSWDGQVRFWPVVQAPVPLPLWIPDLAEALAGQRFEGQEGSVPLGPQALFALKSKILQETNQTYAVRWGKWFLDGGPWPEPDP
jgi:WD40 repeat protein